MLAFLSCLWSSPPSPPPSPPEEAGPSAEAPPTSAPSGPYKTKEVAEFIVGFWLRDKRFYGMRSGEIPIAMWSSPRDSDLARNIERDKMPGVPHYLETAFGHFVNCLFEAFGFIRSTAVRHAFNMNWMTDVVQMGQCVYHGYPVAFRIKEDTGEWGPWMGNELFTGDVEGFESLPVPPPLWLPGETLRSGAVVPDPWGRLWDADKYDQGEFERVFLADRMARGKPLEP